MIDKGWNNGPFGDEGVPFAGGGLFSDGMGWAYEPFLICPGGAAAGAREIVVQEHDEPVREGQFIAHNDWQSVITFRQQEGALVRIGIEMPLRRAIPAGGMISLRAHGLFIGTEDMMGALSYGASDFATPTLSFREWLTRP